MNTKLIGNNISQLRRKAGYTQEQLAEILEVSTTHISHIETGDSAMSLEVLIDIANALHTTPDYILLGNFDITLNRAAQIFMDKTQNFSQDEFDCIFELIDLLNGFKITRK